MEEETRKLQEEQNFSTNPQAHARTPVGFPQAQEEKKNGRKLVLIITILALIGAGTWFFLRERGNLSTTLEETTPSPTIFQPSPTPKSAEVDREGVKIQVLNGTGISGAAGSLQKELEKLGYSGVDVGNASSQDYESTEVTFASSISEGVKDEITEKLEEIYQDVEVKTGTVDRYEVRIITGFPKGHTPTPTSKPKATSTPTPTGGVTGTITISPTKTPTPSSSPSPTP